MCASRDRRTADPDEGSEVEIRRIGSRRSQWLDRGSTGHPAIEFEEESA
jgi:hypothetical protein